MNTNMNRRRFSATLLSAAAASALVAGRPAFAQATPVEGKDFTRIEPPQPPGVPAGKVEVLEFFSYACPHCSSFEPTIEAWEKQLPAEVALRRVPVAFLMNADNFMRAYYALETTGAVQAMQLKIFRAIHIDRKRLEKGEDIAAFVGANGGDADKFLAAFKSFSVNTSVARAKKLMADYKIESVPALVVQGRWMTSPSQAGSSERALAVVDQLVQRVRSGK
jgi:thiol:disulfide interchange protein DsbA